MKSTPSALLNHLGLSATTVNKCIKIERADGQVLTFTDADVPLVIDAQTYKATGGFSATAHRQAAGLEPDGLDLRGIIDDASVTSADLRSGRYRGAKVWIFEVNRRDIAAGKHRLDYGYIGDVTHQRVLFVAQFNSLTTLLNQTIGDKYGTRCRATLGDADCMVVLDPPVRPASTIVTVGQVFKASAYDARRYVVTVGGTTDATEPTWDTVIGNTTTETGGVAYVAAEAFTKEGAVTTPAADNQSLVDTSRTEPAGWFRGGVITWTSGANTGLRLDIKSSGADGTLVLHFPTPFPIAPGDTFTAVTGCNHYLKMPGDVRGTPYTGDCRVKFANAANFMAEPDLPTSDELTRGPQ